MIFQDMAIQHSARHRPGTSPGEIQSQKHWLLQTVQGQECTPRPRQSHQMAKRLGRRNRRQTRERRSRKQQDAQTDGCQFRDAAE